MAEIIPTYLGNKELLTGKTVAFLAPGYVAPLAVMPTYDWAVRASKGAEIIVSGFNSSLEKDVWKLLEENGGSMILVLVRNPFQIVPEKYRKLIEEGRLLIVFLSLETRLSRWSARIRNRYICDIANSIVFPSMNPESSLYELSQNYSKDGKARIVWNN